MSELTTEAIEQTCPHHWMIETAHGRQKSKGVCNKCGEVREFCNSIEATVQEGFNTRAKKQINLRSGSGRFVRG